MPATLKAQYGSGGSVSSDTGTTTTKIISYGTSNQVLSLSPTVAADAPSESLPESIEVSNHGNTPLMILLGYETWSAEASETGATRYLHVMLQPGATFFPEIRAVISTEAASTQFDGTVEDNTKISSINSGLLWRDSTANLAAHVRPAATNPITITVGSNETNLFRVGDLIQIGRGTSQTDLTEANRYREILRVQSITNTTTMVCERALHGTDAGDYDSTNWNVGHGIGEPIYLPFFNAHHDTDKYTLAQTNSNGMFKSTNFFGLGRATSGAVGLVPGSCNLKFYESGYQCLGLSGITESTETGLTAGQEYKIDITVDGGTLFQDLAFTVDSSNTRFGGSNGVLQKIQDAFDAQFYTAGNLFEKSVNVSIVDGDVKFTSGSRLSTSAILLADTGDAYSLFDSSAVGRFPAADNLMSPVAAYLPDDTHYDNVTYASIPNSQVFAYDDGSGNIMGACRGTINYETGALSITNAPANAEFVYSISYNSAFSGKAESAKNALVEILAVNTNQKIDGSVKINLK